MREMTDDLKKESFSIYLVNSPSRGELLSLHQNTWNAFRTSWRSFSPQPIDLIALPNEN